MSSNKVVSWNTNVFGGNKPKKEGELSMRERFQKASVQLQVQEAANAALHTLLEPMTELLMHRLTKGSPLLVMRPLTYDTSALDTEQEDDFYAVRKSTSLGKYQDVQVTIPVGTQLFFKSVDAPLREFVFQDQTGKEHAISYEAKNLLMTQTDIYETTKKYLEEVR